MFFKFFSILISYSQILIFFIQVASIVCIKPPA
jgi:hypothetical protein